MASNWREAVLEGTQAARRLHAELGTKDRLVGGSASCIDVFETSMQLGALLLFRPLSGLLGAYMGKPLFPTPGIIVSTQRPLHIQRFTAAHELGHLYMGHEPSLDGEELGLWRGETNDLQEVAANAFASEFLLPRWLFIHVAAQRQWTSESLSRPDIAYQLSLRLCASYDAVCWGLRSHKILDPQVVEELRRHTPKKLKSKVLAGEAELEDAWADVWLVDEKDNGMVLQGGPNDLVVFQLSERASAGYLWDESLLADQGCEVVADTRVDSDEDACGGSTIRRIIARVVNPEKRQLAIPERRPWNTDDVASYLAVGLDMYGKEEGLPRAARAFVVAA